MSKVRDYAAVASLEDAQILADKLLEDGRIIGFDVETGYSGDPFVKRALDTSHADQFIVGFSITNDPSWARYIPLRHDNSDANLPPREVWEIFRPVLEGLEMVAHHKKFEDKNLLTLHCHGDTATPIRTLVGHDSMIEAYVLGLWKEPGLKFLSEEVLGVKQMTLAELFALETGESLSAEGLKKMRFNVLPVTPAVVDYACDDAALCLELHNHFMEIMEKEPERRQFILRLERRISHLMADMELAGVAVDWEGLQQSYERYPKFAANFLDSVREEFSYYTEQDMSKLNFNSSVQMRKLLYTDMGLSVTRMTKNKDNPQPSTDATALAALSKENPAVQKLLKFREVGVMGTRHKKWINENSHATDKRAHASYNQVRVPTGRFSAQDPAIQQLPKTWFWAADPSVTYDKKNGISNPNGLINGEHYWYGNFRDFIVAAPGKYLLTYDVSQGELRVLAGVSQEKRLIEAFINKEDVHTLTAAMMLGKEPDGIEDSERQIGKALSVNERVLTPDGWILMKDVKEGTVVTTPSGTAKVFGVYPQNRRVAYEVKTSDGGRVVADKNHLWETTDGLKKTRELTDTHYLPTAVWEPATPYKPDVDPYMLGVLLSAGSLGGSSIEVDIHVSRANIFNIMRLPNGVGVHERRDAGFRKIYTVSGGSSKTRASETAGAEAKWTNPLESCLKSLGLRTPYEKETRRRGGVEAHEKFIPAEIFSLSSLDRMEFLRGMVDARGKLNHNRSAEISFASRTLAGDFQRLVWSLGGRALLSNNRVSGRSGRHIPNNTVIFTTAESPFKSPFLAPKWLSGPVYRKIAGVRKLKREFMQCIALDDGIGLFVAGDYMVTHNTMNFALLYQMGEKSLAETLAISNDKASELYANYFKQFSSVTFWMDEARRNGKARGYAETFLGRKMPLWGMDSPVRGVRSAAERASVNYPIQGGLADIVKIIMVRSYDALVKENLWGNGVMMIMNQHDALTFEVDNSLHPEKIRGMLAEAANLRFKGFPFFVIDWEIGKRWGSSEKWSDEPVYQDENGDWHVSKGDTIKVENKPVTEPKKVEIPQPQEPILTGAPALHVVSEKALTRERLMEFFELVKRNPGETEVTIFGPGVEYKVPVKTSLTVSDAPRISLTLDGAVVRVPENSASLAAIAIDLDTGE